MIGVIVLNADAAFENHVQSYLAFHRFGPLNQGQNLNCIIQYRMAKFTIISFGDSQLSNTSLEKFTFTQN